MNAQIVGVLVGDGAEAAEIEWHITGVGSSDYVTACGMDGNDPGAEQHGTVKAKRGQKITCKACYALWRDFRALTLRDANFTPESKR